MQHDLVYTWVNPEDKTLSAARASYAAAEVRQHFEYRAGVTRYRDNGELRMSIESAIRFLPDLRCIHVAYAGTPPRWHAEFPRINFIDQQALLPERFAPLFHSDGVEAFLHRIEGLAEHYVYSNDDFFFAVSEPMSSFFDASGRALIGVASRIAGTPITLEPVFRRAEINAAKALRKMPHGALKEGSPHGWPDSVAAFKARLLCITNRMPAIHTLSHVAQPYRRAAWGDFHRRFAQEVERLCIQKFRSNQGCAINLMYAHYLRAIGLAKFVSAPSHAYIDARASIEQRRAFTARLAQGDVTRFCLNDVPTGNDNNDWSEFVAQVLQQTYGGATELGAASPFGIGENTDEASGDEEDEAERPEQKAVKWAGQ